MSDAQMQQLMELRGRISQAVSDHDLSQAITLYQQLIGLDPDQVLSRTAQLDISNFLASQQLYPQAAAAYEQFQRFYPKYDQIEQVQLMLGVIYARYLHQPQRAKEYLLRALARLHAERDIALARSELAQVAPDALPSPPPA
jgi:outer membrane protein assembly factor BamD (BamD/ComL family)